MMKKLIVVALTIFVVLALSSSAALAHRGPDEKDHKYGASGESNVTFMSFYQVVPVKPYADIIWDGARGQIKYNLAGATFDFDFNGHALDPETEYSLIRSVHVGMPMALDILAVGTPNDGGNIQLAGSYDFDEDLVGARIFLVPSAIIGEGGSLFPGFVERIGEVLFDHTVPDPTSPGVWVGVIDYDDTDVP